MRSATILWPLLATASARAGPAYAVAAMRPSWNAALEPSELLRRKPAPVAKREEEPAPTDVLEPAKTIELPSNVVPLVHPQPASVYSFAARELERFKGGKLEFEDFYLAYRADAGTRALPPKDATEQTQRMCEECCIPIKSVGPHKYLMGVRLKSTSKKALGSMARRQPESA